MSESIYDFILARVAEDESAAGPVVNWDSHMAHEVGGFSANARRFARRTTPARVLAQCKAYRAIVESTRFSDSDQSAVDFWLQPERCDLDPGLTIAAMTHTLKALASTWSDHPDFNQRWALSSTPEA